MGPIEGAMVCRQDTRCNIYFCIFVFFVFFHFCNFAFSFLIGYFVFLYVGIFVFNLGPFEGSLVCSAADRQGQRLRREMSPFEI